MLGFELSEEQLAIQRLAREFTNKEIKPVASRFENDVEGKLAEEIFVKASEIQLLQIPIPEEYGGSGASNIECAIVLEELARGCGGIATAIGATWFGQTPIMIGAGDDQRKEWFSLLAKDGNMCCMAMTEESGGSDIEDPDMHSSTLRTSATISEDRIVLNGTKIWPSNSGNACLYVVLATIDHKLGDSGSCLVVVPAGTPGLSFGKPIRKMGMDADRNAEIFLNNVTVPRGNLLGKIGDGARILQRSLIYNRAGAAAISTGMARGAFEIALNYVKERKVGGRFLIEHELISAMFADMATKIDAARLLYMRAAWFNAQKGMANMTMSTMAKVFASDMSMGVTSNCIQVMGSYGYSKEVGVEKYFRDAKIVQIFLGANELSRQVIGRNL